MTGHKTLAQVRAELEAALAHAPAGTGEVAESLRRFLAAGATDRSSTESPSQPNAPPTESRVPVAQGGH